MNDEINCPLTGAPETKWFTDNLDHGIYWFVSKACGEYGMHDFTFEQLRSGKFKPQQLINCARKCLEVRKEFPTASPLFVSEKDLPSIEGEYKHKPEVVPVSIERCLNQPVDHSKKALDLLEAVAEKSRLDGLYSKHNLTWRDQIWCRISSFEEFDRLIRELQTNGLIKFGFNTPQAKSVEHYKAAMTQEGLEILRTNHRRPKGNLVFVAMQFHWGKDDCEKELREATLKAIQDACWDHGYEAKLVNQNHTDYITNKILGDIREACFMVADFTYNNRGVYFEAGFARALEIPVFHTVKIGHTKGVDGEDKRLHFDIAQIRYLEWENPDSLRNRLSTWIKEVVGKFGD